MLYLFYKHGGFLVILSLSCSLVPLKIVYMKDGRILHQGTLEEIRDENPELVANWRATMRELTESESELSAAEDVEEERAKLVRQISVKMGDDKNMIKGSFTIVHKMIY